MSPRDYCLSPEAWSARRQRRVFKVARRLRGHHGRSPMMPVPMVGFRFKWQMECLLPSNARFEVPSYGMDGFLHVGVGGLGVCEEVPLVSAFS